MKDLEKQVEYSHQQDQQELKQSRAGETTQKDASTRLDQVRAEAEAAKAQNEKQMNQAPQPETFTEKVFEQASNIGEGASKLGHKLGEGIEAGYEKVKETLKEVVGRKDDKK